MLENIYFLQEVDILFLLTTFILLGVVKTRTNKKNLRIETCRIRFVLVTIATVMNMLQIAMEIIVYNVPKQTLPLEIIMIPIWVKICLREWKVVAK